MVELFVARFRETPGASPPDSPLSPRKKLPTPAEVRQSRTRDLPPLGGLRHALHGLTNFEY